MKPRANQTKRQTRADISLSTLSDEAKTADDNSPRLDALLSQLPTYTRTRADYAIYRAGARTLTALCTKTRAELLRCKNVGKKSITDLENTLASFGLTLGERSVKHGKILTPAQRVTNATWLRKQIQQLIKDCDDDIKEDLALADKTYGELSQSYRASVTSTRHWKQHLERILRGKTSAEELADIGGDGAQP